MFVEVAIARPVGGTLTYRVPPLLQETLGVGHVVLVPLGRTAETGYVVGRPETLSFDPARLKSVVRCLDPVPAFDDRQLAFFRWVSEYYLAPLGMVIRTALPSQIRARVVRIVNATDLGVEALTERTVEAARAQVLREVVSRPGLTRKGLVRKLSGELDKKEVERALDGLHRMKLVDWSEREIGEVRARMTVASLCVSPGDALGAIRKNASKMRSVIDTLAGARGPVDTKELVARHGNGARDAVKRLVDAGLVQCEEKERRDVLVEAPALGSRTPPVLNEDQCAALAALTAPDVRGTFLLFGVTGSGKTEVFLGAAANALSEGRQVLVLVPEIGLTPQLVGRFKARFGDQVAVLHSGLTGAERLAEWRRIRAREATVAVGARSALFAPFADLGLIVVDEEHDDSYKQDDGVRYHGRDLCVVLGQRHRCAVILASATPSLESWHNAQVGKYTLLRLPKRATPRPVPSVELVDRTQETVEAGQTRPVFAAPVVEALRETFQRGGKAIVLYNRRGFATLVQCTSCGGSYECPNCGISMTLHQRAGVMTCHYCALKRGYDGSCPVCRAETLEELGKGTERVEQALASLFPEIPRARMDADTTGVRGAHHRILEGFRTGETQLLIGTQIVAKGHDFPDVHTAVVVSADQGFRIPDFRAAERTFALLVQVAGRAGRGEQAGRVLVQTYKPDHYVLRHLDDVDAFLATEMRLRSVMRYPPHTRLVLVRLDGVDRRKVDAAAHKLGARLGQESRGYPGVAVLGPALAAMPRLVGRWRFQIILRGTETRALRAFLRASRPVLEKAAVRGIRVSWDIDPRTLL